MRDELKKALQDMKNWLPSEPAEFNEFVGRLLTSLPDGENDMFEPLYDYLGWKELELIVDLLSAINNGEDVKLALRYLFGKEV